METDITALRRDTGFESRTVFEAGMKSMIEEGKIDGSITADIASVFGNEDENEQYVFEAASKKWRCTVCGYISEGELPPDQCPVCHSDSSCFVGGV